MAVSIESVMDQQVLGRIKDIGRLATLPQVTWELMRLLSDENVTPDDLQRVVEQDPALSAKVLSLGNSAYYALRTPATTISRAIMVIGFKELEFLAMGLGLAETFDLKRVPYGFDGEGLWLQSLSVSWVARQLAAVSRKADASEAMMAGLLHNIGHIILVTHFTVHLQRLMDFTKERNCTFQEAEADLGLWHEAIGFMLAENWKLPKVLRDVILYHHRPEIAPDNQKMVAIINLAAHVVNQTQFALPYEMFEPNLAYLENILDIKPKIWQDILEKGKEVLPQMSPTWMQMLGSGGNKKYRKV